MEAYTLPSPVHGHKEMQVRLTNVCVYSSFFSPQPLATSLAHRGHKKCIFGSLYADHSFN